MPVRFCVPQFSVSRNRSCPVSRFRNEFKAISLLSGALFAIFLFTLANPAKIAACCAEKQSGYLSGQASRAMLMAAPYSGKEAQPAQRSDASRGQVFVLSLSQGEPLLLLICGLAIFLIASGVKYKLSKKPQAEGQDTELLTLESRPLHQEQLDYRMR